MIQIKKTILTLVALLAVTAGAWAEEVTVTFTQADLKGNSTVAKDGVTLTPGNSMVHNDENLYDYGSTTFSVDKGTFTKIEIVCTVGNIGGWQKRQTGSIHPDPVYDPDYSEDLYTLTWTGEAESVAFTADVYYIQSIVFTIDKPTGPTVDWNKASKTGTLTMPGGNVELEPEYYPQAALTATPTAINDVPATTDGAIVEAGTVANIDGTTTAQGTVMYYVSPTALDDAALLALAADKWTADVPTAESLAQGQAYVYYYVRGNDSDTDEENFSDGDILADNALTVTIAAEPTYAVTFAEGTDPNEWTASPAADVKKGQTVTVTYTGSKKVIGVKAEKKVAASATPLDNTTTAWTAGTYAVPAGGLTYGNAITVSGDVTLVLTDGETLTLNKGISLASGATLTIEGNGTMNVNGTSGSTASTVAGTGTLVLTSGTLNAKGGNGNSTPDAEDDKTGADGGVGINGAVTVAGGTLTATGGNGGNCGKLADRNKGGAGGAAISGDVTMTSGTLTATGGNGGDAGYNGDDNTGGAGGAAINGALTINGGTVTTTNGNNGGGGQDGYGNTVGAAGKAVAGTVTDNR